jgi:hypothetical protein
MRDKRDNEKITVGVIFDKPFDSRLRVEAATRRISKGKLIRLACESYLARKEAQANGKDKRSGRDWQPTPIK